MRGLNTLTRRQQILQLLRCGSMNVETLAHAVGAPTKAVLVDLEHIRRTVHGQERWVIHEAECLSCGFVYRGRDRLNTPSHCPKCKSEDIRDPEFEIAEG